MSYYINKKLKGSFSVIEKAVRNSLAEEGFGVLTEINIQEKMKEKLNVDFRKYKILGACNPSFALQALMLEDKIGTMLPCNVIIQELQNGEIEIAAVDPIASMKAIENFELVAIAYDIKEKLIRVVNSISI